MNETIKVQVKVAAMKPKLILCLALVLAYCVLAYIFMWPPIVTERPLGPTADYAVCRNNLGRIYEAINEWALENKKKAGDPVTFEDIKPYLKPNSRGEMPQCPDGGKYSITVVGALPICSLGTNTGARIRCGYFYWEYNPAPYHRLPP